MRILTDLHVRFVRIERGSKRPIEQWKTESRAYTAEEYDRAMLGFNAGVVADDKLVLLDVEGPKKIGCANGWQHLHALQQGHESFPTTLQYLTPSGGCGFIFKKPTGRRVPFFDLSQRFGLELRTGMHYSLIPDSYYDGKTEGKGYAGSYTWVLGPEEIEELPDCPSWLIDWFESQFVKANEDNQGEAPTNAGEESSEYFNCIANNIWELDPDMSYPSWWRVMAVCHRCGSNGYELFVQWSRAGSKHTGADTDAFIDKQWSQLSTRKPDKRLGITWLLDQVKAARPVIEVVDAPAAVAPAAFDFADMWPLTPLTGCLEEFRLKLNDSMPWQSEANYVVPLICAQAAFQRRVLFHKNGLQSHWWALIGPPASNKTTVRDIIKTVLKKIDTRLTFDSFESPNGIKAMFAEYPSKFLVIDEGIKIFNATLANESRSTMDAKVIGILLNLHNNKADQDCTNNRIKAHRIPAVVLPQLGITTFDQESYWETFRTNSAAMNGMISRFALFRLKQMPLMSEQRKTTRLTGFDFETFSRALNRLIPRSPVFNMADPDDYHSWSPIDIHGRSDFTLEPEAEKLINSYNDGLIEWTSTDDTEMRVSVMTRSVEFAVMLSQLIAVCDGTYSVSAAHMRAAIGISFLSLKNLSVSVDPVQNQIIQLCAAILKERGEQLISGLIKALPGKYWQGENRWKTCRQVITEHFKISNDKKVQPF